MGTRTIVKYIWENMSIEHKYLRYQITTWYSVVQEGAAQSFQPGPVTFNLNSFIYMSHIKLIQPGNFTFNLNFCF